MNEEEQIKLEKELENEKKKLLEQLAVVKQTEQKICDLELELGIIDNNGIELKNVNKTIACINGLTAKEKQLLTHVVRTEKNGISAYKTVNHGFSELEATGLAANEMQSMEKPMKKA